MIGWSGVWIPAGAGNFLFDTASTPALGPTQSPIQLEPGATFPGGEADHSPPSSGEFKDCVELYFHSPNTPPWRGAQFKKKYRDNFTLPGDNDKKLPLMWER
jgi:hypothetical protein